MPLKINWVEKNTSHVSEQLAITKFFWPRLDETLLALSHKKNNTSLLMLREWLYTATTRDSLGNTSPEDREISRGRGFCTHREIYRSLGVYFPMHPSFRQCTQSILSKRIAWSTNLLAINIVQLSQSCVCTCVTIAPQDLFIILTSWAE